MTLEDEKWIDDTYGQWRWSMAIDDTRHAVYPRATDEFLVYLKHFVENRQAIDPDFQGEILRDHIQRNRRKLSFVFQKSLRDILRQENPGATSISTSLGEVVHN